jgi:hypothetical protein
VAHGHERQTASVQAAAVLRLRRELTSRSTTTEREEGRSP